MTARADNAPGETRARGSFYIRYMVEPYLYLSPAVIVIALVMLVPLVIGISYAFQAVNLLRPFDTGWVGFENFQALWSDRKFWLALKNTFWWTVGSITFQFFLGLGLALLLNTRFYGKRLVQALVFLPWAVPTFLSALTWAWLFNPTIGPLPHWLAALGILSEPYNILGDPDLAMWGPITANVWFGIPFFAITLLAALQSIPGELYEAAEIDGASAWQTFTKITLPFLAPMIAITVMLRTIWIANFADLIFVMTGGGPANSTQILSTYIFTTAFRKLDFGYASAIAVALLGLLLIYAVVLLVLRRKLVKI
ncbi:multiple sugar transport system permease protein [Labrenzia sp. EL_208]|uniref:Trehalose transport system permease protein SugA n=2 Tax=Roseibium album TaxID=311410 RepID=A0A0M7A1W3_9HYPH|nr:multiple sugar transport system permease protein [Labrenzia sp. EL_142]MBG6159040.1 multiple sugar transport system permease protein [Labrenzia sp. EL_162]MBG6165361.1 multiple sugar transport system permease protein [Labrenzia sp. EL_195]MBG6177411.1 multiple sugar transport system permease protein [Labrenzia sp. EL_132]MBG6197871.1 multiple sugar transport system permease protein [Labrenzia sp. EL_159]MBG6204292.1 multiple sugar transport system permease protein [Labrenzia sp. EL_13]MBG6